MGRFGTPNSADRTGTFTFNASQNMDDVTSEVPTMGALLDAADTENITARAVVVQPVERGRVSARVQTDADAC